MQLPELMENVLPLRSMSINAVAPTFDAHGVKYRVEVFVSDH